jgi:aminopeptidase N
MKRIIFLTLQIYCCIFSAFTLTESFAKRGGELCRHIQCEKNSTLWTLPPKRPYKVISYDLTLDWRQMFETHSLDYTGLQKILLELTGMATSVALDAATMGIDSIRLNGTPVLPVPTITSGSLLKVTLPTNLRTTGSRIQLDINYHKDELRGVYFYQKGDIGSWEDTTVEDIASTFSEPTLAHYWMPCNDRPDNKAESQISIIVPDGIMGLSNGELISKESFSPTSSIWHWKSDEPIATYLMVADASKFVH